MYDEVLKQLKPLQEHPQLHNAFLEYCLPPYNEQKLYELLNAVSTCMSTCIEKDFKPVCSCSVIGLCVVDQLNTTDF